MNWDKLKRLKDILKNCGTVKILGDENISIGNICFDSRKVMPSDVFIAVSGTAADGHRFISSTIEKGAVAIICEKLPEEIADHITYIQVENSAIALGVCASNYYDCPSENLILTGITGTNGKTTTATLLYELFKKSGYKTGLLSTVCNYIHNEEIPATHTTPDPVQLNALLARMVETGCQYCFMEVSSHSIHQHRIAGLKFAGGIFSNITHDHLDYHKTFDEYIKAKKMFFDNLPGEAFALSNFDDRNGKVMLQNTNAKKYSYSLRSMADFKCRILENHFEGMKLNMDGNEIWTRFIGKFNAYNLLAVYSAAVLLGLEKQEVLTIISELKSVNGRFEYFVSLEKVTAIVDYAHTPDALKNVLTTINEISEGGQVITVVGAGGDRDKTKRPEMAKIACNQSNKVILTSDNPRSENPEDILNDMMAGVDNMKKVLRITDRKEAIRTAVMIAASGDIILIAGKGHETYQEIKGVKHHFDDKEIIKELFKTS